MKKTINNTPLDGIIFDLDGTLWDATSVTAETWRTVLGENPDVHPALDLDLPAIRRHMGLTNEELGQVFFPDLPPEEQMRLMKASCDLENQWLAERGGVPYPNCLDVLCQLSKKYGLYIVSNCQCGYIECFLNANGAAPYIRDIECSGNTGLTKAENIRFVIERNGLHAPIYVGDTTSDSTAAALCGIPFVYARYGFGETYGRGRVTQYTDAIDSLSDLCTIL